MKTIQLKQTRSPNYRTVYVPEWCMAVECSEHLGNNTATKPKPNAVLRQAMREFAKKTLPKKKFDDLQKSLD